MKIPKIEYEIYTKYNRSYLYKEIKIDISIPHILTENKDRLNSSSKYHNDICYISTSDKGRYNIKDRKEEYINNNKQYAKKNIFFQTIIILLIK